MASMWTADQYALLVILCAIISATLADRCDWSHRTNSSVFLVTSDAETLRSTEVWIFPPEIEGLEEDGHEVLFVNVSGPTDSAKVKLQVRVTDTDVAKIEPSELILNVGTSGNFTITGKFLGRTKLLFYLTDALDSSTSTGVTAPGNSGDQRDSPGAAEAVAFDVSVVRGERLMDRIFIGIVTLMVIFANVGMGCKIKLSEVKEILKKPIAPAIGFACQFLIMPLLAFAVAVMLKLSGGAAVGFFAAGCAPGGGASNVYTYLVRGDVSLSVTMTLISTAASFGMVPLWLYTLGQYLLRHLDICLTIPFTNILATLCGIIIPVGIGLLIQHYKPNWAVKIRKMLRPLAIFFILFMFTFGVYANLYMFQLFTPKMILAGCLLPYVGFILGMLAAVVCCQTPQQIRTIAIETGIQNSGVSILLMKYSLPQPEADLAIVPPVIVATFTPIPMILMVAGFEIYYRCFRKDKADDMEKHGKIYTGVPKELPAVTQGIKFEAPLDDKTVTPMDDQL